MRRSSKSSAPAGDIRAWRAFEDHSGVSALVDVRHGGVTWTYSAMFLGEESTLTLISRGNGSRRDSKIAADMAARRFAHELEALTSAEYREATRAFYEVA